MKYQYTTTERESAPSFGDLDYLEPGVYPACNLNPPGGSDCTHLLVHDDGTLSWCDADGVDTTDAPDQRFTAAGLRSAD